MLNTSRKLDLLALFSAIPASFAFQMNGIILAWLIYVLAFCAFLEATPKECFRRGMLVGIGAGIINFSWILIGGGRFTGQGVFLSIAIVLGLTVFLALYIGLIAWIYGKIKWKRKLAPDSYGNLINALIIACIFVVFDSFMVNVADSFALILYVTYIPLATDFIAIQPASIFGPLFLTGIIVFINGVIAHLLYYRIWSKWYLPILMVGAYYLFSFGIYKRYEGTEQSNQTFSVAILAENLSPEFKWDDKNGNALVAHLFKLTKEAIQNQANLVLWSETAIPWNFTPNDDFVLHLAKLSSNSKTTHLLGMNTDFQGNTYYNSIYCIQPDFKLSGRYDKRLPLSLIEKPFLGVTLPFYNSNGFLVKEADNDTPLATPYGKAGVLLCNESTIPYLSYNSVKQGAQFLVNPGNDGWFSDTYIAKQHFYHARLRAVETRRDVIVNNNAGFSGLIKASGEIEKIERKEGGYITMVHATPHNGITFAVMAPRLIPTLAFLCLVFFALIGRFRTDT